MKIFARAGKIIMELDLSVSQRIGKEHALRLHSTFNGLLRRLTSYTHQLQMRVAWSLAPQPEWFDHYQDLYYQWHTRQNPLWLERGCFSLLALKDQAKVLELCCGDGFNAYHFYSIRAYHITAVDLDVDAIRHARKFNLASNIHYDLCDIRKTIPEGEFDNIIWDAAIEHFTPIEIDDIMSKIKERMSSEGVLSGYTIVERSEGGGSSRIPSTSMNLSQKMIC